MSQININEYKTKKDIDSINEIKQYQEKTNIGVNKGRELRLDDIILNTNLTNIEKNEQIFAILSLLSEKRREELKPVMEIFCNKPKFSEDDYFNFDLLWSQYLQPLTPRAIKKLIIEAMKNLDKISMSTIYCLLSLSADDLKILKIQFKYVTQCGILAYNDDLQDIPEKELILDKYCGDLLKFTNNIWLSGRDRVGITILKSWFINNDYYCIQGLIINTERTLTEMEVAQFDKTTILTILENLNHKIAKIFNKNLICTKQPQMLEYKIEIKYIQQLTSIGMEMYELLKDEIEEMPQWYLNKILEYYTLQYPDLGIKLI